VIKILIVDIYKKNNHRLVKDTAGGYGTGNDFGNSFFTNILNSFVSKMIAMPPMHAMYTFSVLKKKNVSVEYTKKIDFDEIINFDYLIFVSSIICCESEISAIKEISEKFNKKIFITGIFANIKKNKYQFKNTYVVPGEPEFFFQSLECKKEELDLFFESNNYLFKNKTNDDINDLPFPDWEYYTNKYPLKNNFLGFNSKTAIPILATRGCPYSCFNYCTYPLQQGRKVRARSIDNIIEEIVFWKNKLGTNKFIFRDPVFSINKKHTEELCHKILEKKLDIIFLIETHLKNLDDDLINLLSKAGLKIVYVGIESSSEIILNNIKRFSIKNDEQYSVIKKCKDKGIIVKSMFMIGNPSDSEQSILDTIEYSLRLPNQLVQYSVFTPYPGTPIYKEFEDKILVKSYEDFNQYNLVYSHQSLDQAKINKLKKLAYLKFYLNIKNLGVVLKSYFSLFR
jgi:radical SAM superfamily enzyme YgiQ (UPF0313 family)